MLNQLLETVEEADIYRTYHPRLAPLAWYFGRSIYLETYWLREVVQADAEITTRVRHIFSSAPLPSEQQLRQLPPKDHLLNWALELQEENLMRLANPSLLGAHPLLTDNRLHWIIVQEHARNYEKMVLVLNQRKLAENQDHRVQRLLTPRQPDAETVEVHRGHYRLGANQDPAAYDNEQPTQIVELSGYRIQLIPVSNAAWLAFMQADGYSSSELWSNEGWSWQQQEKITHPHYWRQDQKGNWYAIGLNGPFELIPEEPVSGICKFEAEAYANWLSTFGDAYSGAVPQHEFQWEVAARNRAIRGYGRVWEWCANIFQPYNEFHPAEYPEGRTMDFDDKQFSLRGACIHTQRALQRPSFRHRASPGDNHLVAGVRLVFPPD